jgi:translation initiation factor 1
MAKNKNNLGTVYSTDQGKTCPFCGNPVKECSCKLEKNLPEGDGIVRLSRETKGRKGKGVTVITGLLLPLDQLKTLAKKLKQKCGTGGTLKNGNIEIQGDHRDTLFDELSKQGFKVKISGG